MCSTIPGSSASNSLLSGNGKIWVEVFGDPFAEKIVFQQEKLLQPWKSRPMEAPNIASVLPEVRRLMLAGEYDKGLRLSLDAAEKTDTKPGTGNLGSHPAFEMRIDVPGRDKVENYLRTTDFESGEVKVRWTDRQGEWERRIFVSRPDNAVVQLLSAPAGAALNATLRLDTSMILSRPRNSGGGGDGPQRYSQRGTQTGVTHSAGGADQIQFTRNFDPSHLILRGAYVVDHGNPGYASVTRIVANGGEVHMDNDALMLQSVRSLTLITRAEAYSDLKDQDVADLKAAVDAIPADYQTLMNRHRPGQAGAIDRVSLDVGGSPLHAMSGEELLSDQKTRLGYNPALLENMLDMGRYWLYLRSGDYPPMWGHVNINVNLQISGAVLGDLPETIRACAHWLDELLPDAKTNARNIFGTRGALFAIHPTVEGGPLTHFDYTWPHHYWISAGGWMYSPLWDYYLATGDQEFLRKEILPGLKELALFYEDFLAEKDANGNYIFVPSYSPENWPSNTQNSPAVINAAMDIAVCHEVLTHLISAAEILGVDGDAIPRWKAILAKLPPYLLDTDGALKEWAWPTIEEGESNSHRHVSHLYAVWPTDEITPDTTPELARAALIADRKRGEGGEAAHGLLHRTLAGARLKDQYLANFGLKHLLEEGYVNGNLTTMHNPYQFPSPDPQGGIPTIIMEMLAYSRPGVIEVLPALSPLLVKGSINGMLARTFARFDKLAWDMEARTVDLTVTSFKKQDITLIARHGIEGISAPAGVLAAQPQSGSATCDLHLPEGKAVELHLQLGQRNPGDWATRVV
jgi:hypothetical protein